MSEFMRRMKDMAKMGGGGGYAFMGNMPDNYNVAVNGNHSIIQKILKADEEDQKVKLAKQSYDLALLSQNLLTGADLTSFIKRSVDLVS
jgi:molecular chaperone HtpG